MSRFDRYLLSQLMVLFGFFALVLVAVYWVNRAVSLFDRLIGDGQSALVFLEFTALTLPNVIRLVLPVAAFAASIYVTNRLAGESELVVMQATGFSSFRLARPVLYFGLIVALLLSVLTHILVPASRAQLAERSAEIAENITSRFLKEGSFVHPADGITFFIREITPQGELRGLFLADARSDSARITYSARSAMLVRADSGPKLVMFDGMAQRLRLQDNALSVTRFGDFTYDIGALIAPRGDLKRKVAEFPTATLLMPSQSDLDEAGASLGEMRFEGHSRIADPMMAIAVSLLGFAALLTGTFSRFGVWRQVMGAIVLVVVLQLISNMLAGIAIASAGAWPLAYVPPALGIVLAGAILAYSQRERPPRHRSDEVPA